MTESTTQLQRLAAPAPGIEQADDRELDTADDQAAEPDPEFNLDELCWAWAAWSRQRRLYVKPSLPVSVLGRLRTKGTGRSATGGPDAPCSAELLALHTAIRAQPVDAKDTIVFLLHYGEGVRNIKAASAAVDVSRQHWYRLLRAFRSRVYIASREILQVNQQAARDLPSMRRGESWLASPPGIEPGSAP